MSIILDQIKKTPSLLKKFKTQTSEMCFAAIKASPICLKHVISPTYDMILMAISLQGGALKHVPKHYQTQDLCLMAMKNGGFLKHSAFQNEEICLAAVNSTPNSFIDVLNQTPKVCLLAVEKDGMMLEYVKNKTLDICLAAMNQNLGAFKYVTICENKDPHSTLEILKEMKRLNENKVVLKNKIESLV